MLKIFRILIGIIFLSISMTANGQLTAANALKTIPVSKLMQLSQNNKLDLIDYANAGITDKGVKNRVNYESKITYFTDDRLDINITQTAKMQIVILPIKGRKIIALIETVMTPTPDSALEFYASNWVKINLPLFNAPTLDDWLTPLGKKNVTTVQENVQFFLTGYVYDEKSEILTVTTNLKEYITQESFSIVKDYLYPSLEYKWNGNKFVKIKRNN